MSGGFRVVVAKEDLVFAAAHFITMPGHRCEALHGHNYRAGAVLEGAIAPDAWFVVDFGVVKKALKELTDALDHRVLLPTENPRLAVRTEGDRVTVAYDGRPKYVFPASDCVLLPMPNTTVEMLARHVAGRLRAALAERGATGLGAIEIEIEENFGQSAIYREEAP